MNIFTSAPDREQLLYHFLQFLSFVRMCWGHALGYLNLFKIFDRLIHSAAEIELW